MVDPFISFQVENIEIKETKRDGGWGARKKKKMLRITGDNMFNCFFVSPGLSNMKKSYICLIATISNSQETSSFLERL